MIREGQTKLDFYHAFGSQASESIRDCVMFGDDETGNIIYPVGRHIAVRSLDSNDISFIKVNLTQTPPDVTRITAIAITKEKTKRFLAVAEYLESERCPQITVVDLKHGNHFKSVKKLRMPDTVPEECFKTIAFSHDSKLIAAVSDRQHIGVLWDMAREKLVGRYEIGSEITRVSISPKESHKLCTSGPNHWKSWRVQEKTFKPEAAFVGISQHQNFTDHDWLDEDTIVAVSDLSEFFIVKNGELVKKVEFAMGGEFETASNAAVTSICTFSRGFILGNDEGMLALWEKTDNNEMDDSVVQYSCIKSWSSGKKQSIVSLTLSNNEENIGVAFRSNDIGICSLSQITLGGRDSKENKLNIFCSGFHSGPINSMDIAVHRPLIATCSNVDATIRIWNYHNPNCELAKKLYVVDKDTLENSGEAVSRPLQCLAFHPSGYYIAVGFVDKLRLFHLLYDELRFFREVSVQRSNFIKFSNGGSMLAAASLNMTSIFNAYTLEKIAVLKNHVSQIQQVAWGKHDRKLFTAGADGMIFEYSTTDWSDQNKYELQATEYQSITVNQEDYLIAAGLSSQTSVLTQQQDYNFQDYYIQSDKRILQCCYFQTPQNTPIFLTGDSHGSIQFYGNGPDTSFLDEIEVHFGAVTQIVAAPDGRFVFTAGEDCTIFVFRIIEAMDINLDRTEGKEKDTMSRIVDESLGDIVLIEREQLEHLKSEQQQAQNEMDSINETIRMNSQKRETQYLAEIQKLKDNLMEEIRSVQSRIDDQLQQKARQEEEFIDKLQAMENKHGNEVDNLENMYERKLNIEEERYRQLEHDLVEMKQHYEEQIKTIKVNNEKAIEDLEIAFKDALAKAQDEYENTKKIAEDLKEEYESRLMQQIDEHEVEVMELNQKFDDQIHKLDQQNLKLVEDQNQCRQDQRQAKEANDRYQHSLSSKRTEAEQIQAVLRQKRQLIDNLEKSKTEKESTLMKKENKLYEYKHYIKELQGQEKKLYEKKKQILDEMHPKDEDIETFQARLQSVFRDFKKEKEDNEELMRKIQGLDDLQKRLKMDKKAQNNAKQDVERIIKSIMNEVHYAVTNLDTKAWPDELKKLYHNYVKNEANKAKKEPDNIEALEHQLKYMEKNLISLKEARSNAENRFRVDLRKRTHENSTLLQELNKLKLDNKRSEMLIKQLAVQEQNLRNTLAQKAPKEAKRLEKPKIISDHRPTPFQYRISPMDARFSTMQDKQRIIDLQNELEEKKEQNFYLRIEINQLREMIEARETAQQ